MTPLAAIPFATIDGNPNATRALQQIRDLLAVRFGASAPVGERTPTWDELRRAGLVRLRDGSGQWIGGDVGVGDIEPVPIPGSEEPDGIPPAPTGFVVTPALATNILEWTDARDLFAPYGFTEIWRAQESTAGTPPGLGEAVLIGQTPAPLYADGLGVTGAKRYYWIRHVSKAGTAGPFNAVAGTVGETGLVGRDGIAAGAVDSLRIADGAIVTAKIGTASITTVKIADGQITDAKITTLSAGKLRSGVIGVDTFISSTNYVPGMLGWSISGAGNAEFNGVLIRGSLTAGTVDLTGGVDGGWGYARSAGKWIGDGGAGWVLARDADTGATFFEVQGGSSLMRLTSWGDNAIVFGGNFSVNAAGNLFATGATIRGDIEATSINAGAANIVSTLNIAGEAVTIPRGATESNVVNATFTSDWLHIGFPAGASACALTAQVTVGLSQSSFDAPTTVDVFVMRDASVIGEARLSMNGGTHTITVIGFDTAAAGGGTYFVRIVASATIVLRRRTLLAIGSKR